MIWQPTVPQLYELNVHLWVKVQDCPGLNGGHLSVTVVQPLPQPYQPQLPMVWQTFHTGETDIAGVRNSAGVSAGLAAFHIARRGNANESLADLLAGVGEVHIRQAGAVGQSNRELAVISLSIAALVAARLAMIAAPIIFPTIAAVAVFPVAGVGLIPPAFRSAAHAMDVSVIFVPAIAAVAVFPVVAGRPRRLRITRRRRDLHNVSSTGEIREAITAVRIRGLSADNLVPGINERHRDVRDAHVANGQITAAIAIGEHMTTDRATAIHRDGLHKRLRIATAVNSRVRDRNGFRTSAVGHRANDHNRHCGRAIAAIFAWQSPAEWRLQRNS